MFISEIGLIRIRLNIYKRIRFHAGKLSVIKKNEGQVAGFSLYKKI
jgi:hypothetical protein